MKPLSTIYLWKERTLFVGTLDDPVCLSQGAATLCISLGESFRVKQEGEGRAYTCTSVLIPPGCSVEVDTQHQPVANLNLDVMGADFFNLSLNMSQQGDLYFGLKGETEFRAALTRILQEQCSLSETKATLEQLMAFDTAVDNYAFNKDRRVQAAVDLIQSSIEMNLSIECLAEKVNLSIPGLTRLFKKQTGVPIRRYRQWHRLYITATEIGKGRTLTDAALAAGFVDLPHCTHTFNMMLGMKPSYFLSKPDQIRVVIEP